MPVHMYPLLVTCSSLFRTVSRSGHWRFYSTRPTHLSYNTIDYFAEGIDIEDDLESKPDTFEKLGVTTRLTRLLSRDGIKTPTLIQSLSLPYTMKRNQPPLIIQSQTGSGKTLSYLLPTIQDIRPGLNTLIITPSRELAVQIYHIAKRLAGNFKNSRRVSVLFSCPNEEDLFAKYRSSNPNILIGTPKKVLQLMEEEEKELPKKLQTLSRVVLDDGDNLFPPLNKRSAFVKVKEESRHRKPTQSIMDILKDNKSKFGQRSLICVSATMPAHSLEELTENGWGEVPNIITTVESSERMRIPDTISHEVIKCGDDNKIDVLVSHFNKVKRERGEGRALVFIHRDSSINQFMSELAEKDIKHRALYKEVMDINKYRSFLRKFKNGDIEMVVGTEETVRGLDFSFVRTLYLTEVPRDGVEYLHLAGRVGRMGREGEVVVLIGGEKQDRDTGRLERMYKKNDITNIKINNTNSNE